MQLTEQHIITKVNSSWKRIDELSFLSKNLYNQALYFIKHSYNETNKFVWYYDVEKHLRLNDNVNYILLPNNTSQQILLLLDKNIKAFFTLLKKWKKNKSSLQGRPQFPKYKDKIKGRNILIFTYNQCKIRNGYVYFPKKTRLHPIKTKVEKLQQVRIVPKSSCYVIEIIYNFKEVQYDVDKTKYLGIDLGINNLCALITNQSDLKPLLVNGRIIKSINQYTNKLIAKEQSQLKKNHNKYSSKKLEKIRLKRENKLKWHMHNISKFIIQYCINNEIGNIIIGHNKEWKQNINIGKINNQKFSQIPFNKFIQQIQYKAKMVGVSVIITEESYTSKIDHLALEMMKHHNSYLGKRIYRGLFQSSFNLKLNADINGSIGILRKVIGDEFISVLNRGLVVSPLKI